MGYTHPTIDHLAANTKMPKAWAIRCTAAIKKTAKVDDIALVDGAVIHGHWSPSPALPTECRIRHQLHVDGFDIILRRIHTYMVLVR